MHMTDLFIVDYTDAHAAAFYDINAQWIQAMYVLEPHDIHVLSHPRETIIDPGGVILLVASATHGIIGAGALMKARDGVFELTKMGVLDTVRGQKAGEFLLRAIVARAEAMAIDTLFLLTNTKSQAAIHLYEKVGFVHDAAIMREFGGTYDRCDVAMRYPLAIP
jgi:ribosomal protein S18 acetylase RimI-like enzyme